MLAILERVMLQVRRGSAWLSAHRERAAWRRLRWIVSLGIVAICAGFIARQIAPGYNALSVSDIRFDGIKLLVAWCCIAASTVLGAWEWSLLVNAMGGNLKLATGMRIHLVANLSKYMPGYIWPYVGKAYLATREGVPARLAALSIAVEFGIVYQGGILLLILSWPFSGLGPQLAGERWALQVVALLIAGIGINAPVIIGLCLASKARPVLKVGEYGAINWWQVIGVTVAVFLTWCLLAFGFYMIIASISSTFYNILAVAVALPLALLGGQLALFVPMGLGVREAILVAMLGTMQPAALLVLVAIMFRLGMVLGEVVSTLFIIVLDKLRNNRLTNPNG